MARVDLLSDEFPALPNDPGRSRGLHLSDILYDLAVRTGVLKKPSNGWSEDATRGLWTLGRGWESERAADMQRSGWEWQPGEMTVDGIHMTPDFRHPEMEVVGETKATTKSCRDVDPEVNLQMYLWQLKAYTYGYGWTTGMLDVCFILGDYERPFVPKRRLWWFEWEKGELEENWWMVVTHKGVMERERAEGAK